MAIGCYKQVTSTLEDILSDDHHNKRFFINLTPFIPLSLKGEGEGFEKRG